MTRQIEIATEIDLKWFAVKKKWMLGASGWTECRVKAQSGRGIQLITEVQSVQGMQPTNTSIVQCRMRFSSLSAGGLFPLARKATSETLWNMKLLLFVMTIIIAHGGYGGESPSNLYIHPTLSWANLTGLPTGKIEKFMGGRKVAHGGCGGERPSNMCVCVCVYIYIYIYIIFWCEIIWPVFPRENWKEHRWMEVWLK